MIFVEASISFEIFLSACKMQKNVCDTLWKSFNA